MHVRSGALVEYRLVVPASRYGCLRDFSVGELKVIQAVVTLTVFGVVAFACLGETLRWDHLAGSARLVAAAAFMFLDRGSGVA